MQRILLCPKIHITIFFIVFRSGFKNQEITKIKKLTDIVLDDGTGKPKVFGVTTGAEALAVGDLHQHGEGAEGDQDLSMPAYEEDDNQSFALLALASQEEISDIRFYERVKKLHNTEAKIKVCNGHGTHELKLNHFLRLEKVLKNSKSFFFSLSLL